MISPIVKKTIIEEKQLDQNNYFQSYLKEARGRNLLSEAEIQHMQVQMAELLARQIERYTRFESSSVKIEVAEGIIRSILYGIDSYLINLCDTDECLKILKGTTLSQIYQKGLQLIKSQVKEAEIWLKKVQDNHLEIDNYAYKDTLNALPDFFIYYDTEFFAHHTPASIDYPLYLDKMDTVGINYMSSYLQKLFYENGFCNLFPKDSIKRLLEDYHEQHEELLINIFQLILINALGSVIIQRSAKRLDLNALDCEQIYILLADKNEIYLKTIVREASDQLIKELNITGFLENYIKMGSQEIAVRLKNALENNQMGTLFVLGDESKTIEMIYFEDREKMDDALFIKLSEEIRSCRELSDKLMLLKSEIYTLEDMLDILEADCFFGEEYEGLFKVLDEMEIAMLLKSLNITNHDDFNKGMGYLNWEKEWQKRLYDYLEQGDTVYLEHIVAIIEKIKFQ